MKLPNLKHTGLTRFDRNVALGVYYGYSKEAVLKYVRRVERIKKRGYDESKDVHDCFTGTGYIATKADTVDAQSTIDSINVVRLHPVAFPNGFVANHEIGDVIAQVMQLPIFAHYINYIKQELKR
ncbi:hypothetical protein ABEL47_01705 [Escherichia coli]